MLKEKRPEEEEEVEEDVLIYYLKLYISTILHCSIVNKNWIERYQPQPPHPPVSKESLIITSLAGVRSEQGRRRRGKKRLRFVGGELVHTNT
ncbi:hypothetical protein E2C01_084803 [Portunus trituberculatus]|uniref:Uncharacterized protein n=1 Tax=Portunus trituberculatus TaxID=210409 RepID=A0A5B7J0Y4_PORTR|nr:hypothetical protein [Portunus trituberculatus]